MDGAYVSDSAPSDFDLSKAAGKTLYHTGQSLSNLKYSTQDWIRPQTYYVEAFKGNLFKIEIVESILNVEPFTFDTGIFVITI